MDLLQTAPDGTVDLNKVFKTFCFRFSFWQVHYALLTTISLVVAKEVHLLPLVDLLSKVSIGNSQLLLNEHVFICDVFLLLMFSKCVGGVYSNCMWCLFSTGV